MGFSRQEYWNGWPIPPPQDFPNPGMEPTSLTSPTLAGGFFTTWEAHNILAISLKPKGPSQGMHRYQPWTKIHSKECLELSRRQRQKMQRGLQFAWTFKLYSCPSHLLLGASSVWNCLKVAHLNIQANCIRLSEHLWQVCTASAFQRLKVSTPFEQAAQQSTSHQIKRCSLIHYTAQMSYHRIFHLHGQRVWS